MLIMHSILSVLCNTLSYVLLYKLLAATTTADTLVSRAKFINFVLHYCGLHFLILAVDARGRMKLDENYDRICNTSGANIRKIYIPPQKKDQIKVVRRVYVPLLCAMKTRQFTEIYGVSYYTRVFTAILYYMYANMQVYTR